MNTVDINQIRSALLNCLHEYLYTIQHDHVIVLSQGMSVDAPANRIWVLPSLQLGLVGDGELGGRQGIAPRQGVFIIALSCRNVPQDVDTLWRMASEIEQHFWRSTITADKGEVVVGDTYTTNTGEVDKRLALTVNVPFMAWAGGLGD